MSILAAPRRPVNRVFGEGIIIEPVRKARPAKRPVKLARVESQVWDADRQVWAYTPAVAVQPEPDAAWFTAFNLGRDGVAASPCSSWTSEVKAAFIDGHRQGDDARRAAA